MRTRTDLPSYESSPAAAAGPETGRKPSMALAAATVCGIGYIPVAPGTGGSVVGLALYCFLGSRVVSGVFGPFWAVHSLRLLPAWLATAAIALVGVWAADRTATFLQTKDPQCVVVDEVSGQLLTYVAALAPLNWKYLLLGFILFRACDIWKPFPARQAESLPGGLGIMADDWMAGVYAAVGLWIARAAGL
ncbi:MAG: phosphatidylglycerophosphatase A [Candidatus Acidiferrales bacterium]